MTEAMTTAEKPMFRDIDGGDEDPEVTEVESMCMSCHENVSISFVL